MALPVDAKVGPYQILGSIGSGGMGEVYRARDLRLSRDVAIKVLRADVSRDADLVRRFEMEARAVGALNHPNILTVFDTGAFEGLPYLVSELLQGATLRDRLQSGPLEVRKAVEYGVQIARGLAAAHERGIVHRDLKPENLFVTTGGVVKILDFGIAKLTHPEEHPAGTDVETASHTTPGTVIGTRGYMSPEQVRGLQADARSDLFSFGAVLFEMLTGNRAFKGATLADTMSAVLNLDPTPELLASGRIPRGVVRIVARCLEKSREDRFQTARELASALEFTPDDTKGDTTKAFEDSVPPPRTSFPRTAVLPLILVGVMAMLASSTLQRDTSNDQVRYQRLTFQLGDIMSARFAPDGGTLVYSAKWGASPMEIFTTRPSAGGSRPVGLKNALVLAVSARDELAILIEPRLLSWNLWEGTLAEAPLSGGPPRERLEGVTAADWSPDGKELAVVHAVADRQQIEYPIGRMLYARDAPAWFGRLRVSPSGDHIAFLEHSRIGDTGGDVKVIDLKSGNVKALATGFSTLDGLAWSADGKEIWFAGQIEGGPPRQLHASRVSGETRMVTEFLGAMSFFDRSASGVVLLGRSMLWTEVRGRARGSRDEVEMPGADLSFLNDITPDGTRVLGTDIGVGGGPNFTAFLQSTDGLPPVRLAEGDGQALSPDGRSILVKLRTTPPKLKIEPTGAGQPQELPLGSIMSYDRAVWAPSGKRVIFAGTEKNKGSRLYAQDVSDQSLPEPFTAEGIGLAKLGRPVSPDGKWIVGIGGDGVPELYPLAGGEPRVIPTLGYLDMPVSWSEDGRELFVVRYEESTPRVDRVEVATGRTRPWTAHRPRPLTSMLGDYRILISPDGESYAYNYVSKMSDLYIATGIR